MTTTQHHAKGRPALRLPTAGSLLLTLLASLALVSPTAPPAAAQEPPSPVSQWLLEQGPGLVAASAPGGVSPQEVSFGPVVPLHTWDEAFLRGVPQGDGAVPAQQWAVPVKRLGETVGAVHLLAGETAPTTPATQPAVPTPTPTSTPVPQAASHGLRGEYVDDYELGYELEAVSLQASDGSSPGVEAVVYDEVDHSWFAVGSGVVRPLGATSSTVLAGRLAVTTYSQIVLERRSHTPKPAAPLLPSRWLTAPWFLGVAGGLVLLAALVVLAVLVSRRRDRDVLPD